jgi:isocitrate dehydrogenase
MKYEKIQVPADGQRITINPDSSLTVPDNPYIAFIEGDRR